MSGDRMLAKREVAAYAEVLLDAAQKSGVAFEVAGQIDEVVSAMRSHPALKETLCDSSIDAAARLDILAQVFPDLDASLLSVLGVMVERGELALLARVAEAYGLAAEEALGATFVDVTTVVPLDDALRKSVTDKLEADLGGTVMLREHIDASIIGGIVISAHGRRLDASVANKLSATRAALSSHSIGGER